uniref:Uncharacterized protein n=1 Tax=Oryza brachyantha TaxID=4533 RepID=J3NEB2_ORYBR
MSGVAACKHLLARGFRLVVVGYLAAYARHFAVDEHVRFRSKVLAVEYVGASDDTGAFGWELWNGDAFGNGSSAGGRAVLAARSSSDVRAARGRWEGCRTAGLRAALGGAERVRGTYNAVQPAHQDIPLLDWWREGTTAADKNIRKGLKTLYILVALELWCERNRRIFQKEIMEDERLLTKIKDELKTWVFCGMINLARIVAKGHY